MVCAQHVFLLETDFFFFKIVCVFRIGHKMRRYVPMIQNAKRGTTTTPSCNKVVVQDLTTTPLILGVPPSMQHATTQWWGA